MHNGGVVMTLHCEQTSPRWSFNYWRVMDCFDCVRGDGFLVSVLCACCTIFINEGFFVLFCIEV